MKLLKNIVKVCSKFLSVEQKSLCNMFNHRFEKQNKSDCVRYISYTMSYTIYELKCNLDFNKEINLILGQLNSLSRIHTPKPWIIYDQE